jgi:arsenate reductase (glutaredoxin)
LIKESGKSYTAVNYYDTPFTKSQLKALLKKAKLSAKDILRTKEDIYKALGLAKKDLSDEALIEFMIEYPDLIQRPIVEKGDRAILARPAETLMKLL